MISKTSEYALRALVVLAASSRGGLNASELAEQTGVPASYLAKTLQLLVQGRLLTSRRGVGGGFALARAANEITALDVVKVIEARGPAASGNTGASTPGLVRLQHVLDGAAAAGRERLGATTLAELAAQA